MNQRHNIYLTQLASSLKISRTVLRREIKLLGINKEYSQISDDVLDGIVKDFRLQKEDMSGTGYVIGHIRNKGIKVNTTEFVRQFCILID